MFGEYKLIAIGIIAVVLFGIGATAVITYKNAVAKTAQQEEQIRIRDQVINDQQAIVADQIKQAERAKKYQAEEEQRRIQSEAKIKKILSMESKRDETGKISPDDPILNSLNGMYPPDKNVKSKANHPPGATVPKISTPAGGVARGKDVLPE